MKSIDIFFFGGLIVWFGSVVIMIMIGGELNWYLFVLSIAGLLTTVGSMVVTNFRNL